MKKIVCAANKMSDGTIILGIRHFCKMMHQNIEAHYGKNPPQEVYHNSIQGFVDQHGEFYDRKQAWSIAYTSNQIVLFQKPVWVLDETQRILYSEDLY